MRSLIWESAEEVSVREVWPSENESGVALKMPMMSGLEVRRMGLGDKGMIGARDEVVWRARRSEMGRRLVGSTNVGAMLVVSVLSSSYP